MILNLQTYLDLIKKFCEEINKNPPIFSGAPSSKDVGHRLCEEVRNFLGKELKIKIEKGTFGQPDLPQFATDIKATLFESEKGGRQNTKCLKN